VSAHKQGTPSVPPGQLAELSQLAEKLWGLQIGEKKRAVVEGRLSKLLQATQTEDLPDLLRWLRSGKDAKRNLSAFDVLSTNHTHFFREANHYNWLGRDVLANIQPNSAARPRLRIWSAGCSNGCEPHTIAMVLADHFPKLSAVDARILATDLAISQLRQARQGRYSTKHLEGVAPEVRARHFDAVDADDGLIWQVKPRLRGLVRFGLLNLLDAWPMRGPFDAIFCRNVMIYFDDPTRRALVERFKALLRPGGLLFLGTSEGVAGKFDDLRSLESSAYQRVR